MIDDQPRTSLPQFSVASHSLYRKWRSQTFADIVGQQHVVRTLQNAVKTGRVAHAYLFTGPRGTGKTSMARILAKAVNCWNPHDGAPCGVCAMCISIAEGRTPDIIEIDGASNNSIDDIRILRERVAFAPVEGRYKVYIIDEVHRLSPSAFDGLLKTLEEPPPHVLFIFASTEPHKLPATILSRCQRFDFHKIGREDTMARLQEVAEKEGIAISHDAVLLIAQYSGGSLRDALGLLDQISAFAAGRIEVDDVRQTLGLGHPSTIATLTQCLLDNRVGDALHLVNTAVEGGADARQLTHQLIDYWRNLLLYVSGAGAEVDVDPALAEPLVAHAKRLTPAQTIAVLHALTEPAIGTRFNVAPQLPLELALVQSALVLHGTASTVPTTTAPSPSGHAPTAQPLSPATASPTQGTVPQRSNHAPALTPDTREPAPNEGASRAGGHAAPSPNSAATPQAPAPIERSMETVLDRERVVQSWPAVIEATRARSLKLQALLHDAHPLHVTNTEVTLGFLYTFHRDQISRPENRAVIEAVLSEVLGTRVHVRCVQASREEIRALRAASGFEDDDDFIEEAERLLRAVHARKLNNERSPG
jgi:DNA polymerase-3 subunit gamma/tau